MNTLAKDLLAVVLGVLCLSVSISASVPARSVNLPLAFDAAAEDDDEPAVTDRVARVSFIDGEARLRRSGSDEWEKLTLNLPLVEGDEISTDAGSRIEIQFGKNQHLRLAERSYLKIAKLKDEGIAVSLSLGSLSLRITSFDKERSFFEIDAPKTTLAVQRSGRYRIDAGREGASEVRSSVSNGGEARIYSENAGFTLKNDRGVRIYIDGPNAGEWETGEASRYDDDFSIWAADREEVVARRLNDAHFDKYYDDDIYGADDLNDFGDWVNTPNYGHVWRPGRHAISQYSDWSPYRYGHWRWMQPYGWIWVNDEPWGWATYHHGRWFSYNGYWVWSPYGYYRSARSWWWPALVVINVINTNIYWYPVPYYRRCPNFNRNHQTPRVAGNGPRNPRGIAFGGGPVPIPQPIGPTKRPGIEEVPPTGVVSADRKDFGSRGGRNRPAPPVIARTVLLKDITDDQTNLPDYKRNGGQGITVERPRIDPIVSQTRVGAAPRKTDTAMDDELRTTRISGGRAPQRPVDNAAPTREPMVFTPEPRKTGAVDRPPVRREVAPIKTETNPGSDKDRPAPIREPMVYKPDRDEKPRYTPPPRETPRYDPPKQTERPRIEPQPKQTPRSEPPPAKSAPKPVEKPVTPSRKEKPESGRL